MAIAPAPGQDSVEVNASHVAYMSYPKEVAAKLIEEMPPPAHAPSTSSHTLVFVDQ